MIPGLEKVLSITERVMYYTLDGERELAINLLQKLPARICVVSMGQLKGLVVQTGWVPDRHNTHRVRDTPKAILEDQSKRLGGFETKALPEEGSGVLTFTDQVVKERDPSPAPAAPGPQDKPWPFEG
jgi:hypothetical protein